MTSHNLAIPRDPTPAEHSAATRGDCDIGTLARVVMREIGMVRDRHASQVARSFALFRAYRVLYAWKDRDHPTFQCLERQVDTADFVTEQSRAAA